jgi:hypothetical protein
MSGPTYSKSGAFLLLESGQPVQWSLYFLHARVFLLQRLHRPVVGAHVQLEPVQAVIELVENDVMPVRTCIRRAFSEAGA